MQQLMQALEQEQNLLNRAVLAAFLYTGIRMDEFLTLKRSDYVNTNIQNTLRVVSPRGIERFIPLNDKFTLTLDEYLMTRMDSGEDLFSTELHKAFTRYHIRKIFDVFNVNSRQLRQTFVSELIRLNISIPEISNLVYGGNESIVKNLDSLYNDII
ncbi:tyrosine-type recombinase/integrase [Paenibacillus ferrarius]|uniref:tyrosine-type recombinase/integrase n=1 Tax=Paenibacillus ferrarius TaxID=1469647 RepID=UPI003D264F73